MRPVAVVATLAVGCALSPPGDDAVSDGVAADTYAPPADTEEPPVDTDSPPVDTDVPPLVIEVELVPSGMFVMGSPASEPGRASDEAQVFVTLTRDLWMMRSEVTQGLYEEVTGANPSRFTSCGADCPVEQVSWYDAVAFANLLSAKDGLTPVYSISGTMVTASWDANGWRLPTEAEWERAALGVELSLYAGSDDVDAVAWPSGTSGDRIRQVCTKPPNAYGLCDMSGNVFQWTWDGYGESRAGGTDPAGPSSGAYRVYRGGGWNIDPAGARVAFRRWDTPGFANDSLGFRLARSAP